jgi:hypothetical protein
MTNNMVSIKGHPTVENKIATSYLEKKNLTSITWKSLAKEPRLSWDTELNSTTEYTPQPLSASIHKDELTHITTEEQTWADYKYILSNSNCSNKMH